MKTILILFIAFGVSAAVPEKLLTENIGKKLDLLAPPEKWQNFVKENETLFPKTGKSNDKTHVIVRKEEMLVDGDSYTLGVGYRQTFIKAPITKVKQILNTPELFKSLYGLDANADVEPIQDKKRENVTAFKARIFKHVPLVPDQDYVLDYENKEVENLWVQRAKLHKDNSRFALRDNLKVLESSQGGTIFREVSVIYALKWYVRFFGPGVRDVMTKETVKITDAVKCLAESEKEPTSELAESCWKISAGL